MRILRNVVLITLPLLLMINLYRWAFSPVDAEFTFKGLGFLHQNIQTFNGLDTTFAMFESIQEEASRFSNIDIDNIVDVFNAGVQLVKLIGMSLSIPIIIVVDIVRDIWWFIETMFIK